MRGTLSKQLGVEDDKDEYDEHGNDGVRDELLLVHSCQISILSYWACCPCCPLAKVLGSSQVIMRIPFLILF
jgi:hypothetical protein